MSRIAVVGSVNMDVVMTVERMPALGETLSGTGAAFHPGGKGANQALAAARLGADVSFFGKVGDDPFGARLREGLVRDGVDVEGLEAEADCTTGIASIWVDATGENAIVLDPGANGRVDAAFIDRHLDAIASCDVLLLQLEIPIETIAHLLRRLPPERPRVILDPAPARDLSSLPLERVDVLTPNETELRTIGGCDALGEAADQLLARGVTHVLCTLGFEGVDLYSADGAIAHFEAPEVDVVDTTAAGDAFVGALAVSLLDGSLEAAVSAAVVAGALATTRPGAQDSLPTRAELEVVRRAP